MKRALTIFLILSIVIPSQVFSQPVNNKECTLQIRKGGVVKGKAQNVWTIPTTLTNLSNDTLKYFGLRCSWQDFYSVDNEKIYILTNLCDKKNNIPFVLKLAPKQSRTIELKLQTAQTLDTSFTPFRVGLNIIRANKPTSDFRFDELRIKENILWSNVITIQN